MWTLPSGRAATTEPARTISSAAPPSAHLCLARIRGGSIFLRAGPFDADAACEAGATPFETATELALARKLVRFPDALASATGNLRPHFLCTYLYELAGEFSAFYSADKVAVDDRPVRARRLLLCSRTLLFLETGLQLLGLKTLQKM